jgi:hypothetical protein
VEAKGKNTVTVDRLTLRCEDFEYGGFYQEPSGGFRAPENVPEKELGRAYGTYWIIPSNDSPTFEGPQERYPTGETEEVKGIIECPVRQNGARTVAVGIHGRAGKWLDALGLVCEHPVRPPTPIKAQGRVRLDGQTGTTPLPPLSICAAARAARDRNSPAAPGLEAQCAAQAPVKAQGRVKLAEGAEPEPALSTCEAAQAALARNSPAARGLVARCNAEKNVPLPPVDLNALQARGAEIAAVEPQAATLRDEQGEARRGFEIGLAAAEWNTLPGPGKERIRGMLSYVKRSTFSPSEQSAFDDAVTFSLALYKQKLADLALKGDAIASEDPVSAEFRGLQTEGAAQRGFEIGLAAAEGHTAPGPGKQKIRGALAPAEQGGYDTAVAFSIDRNNNPDLAATGAAIAKADPTVGAQRNRETDALYRLGFDIATGIFGDPALGAQGNTATGPGSLKIRDSLSAAGQRGFDAAAAFHL